MGSGLQQGLHGGPLHHYLHDRKLPRGGADNPTLRQVREKEGSIGLPLGTGDDRDWAGLCGWLHLVCMSEVFHWISEYGE